MGKLETNLKSFPSPYYRKKADSNLDKLIQAISEEDEYWAEQIKNGRANEQ